MCLLLAQIAGNTSAACFVWFAGLLFWPYFLMQTGVGYFRVYAMLNGLAGSKKSGTWKVGGAWDCNTVCMWKAMLDVCPCARCCWHACIAPWYVRVQ